MIEGGMKVYAREQPCPVAVGVHPESHLRKSELFFLSLLGDGAALK